MSKKDDCLEYIAAVITSRVHDKEELPVKTMEHILRLIEKATDKKCLVLNHLAQEIK